MQWQNYMMQIGEVGMQELLSGSDSVMKMECGAGALRSPIWLLKAKRLRQSWSSWES